MVRGNSGRPRRHIESIHGVINRHLGAELHVCEMWVLFDNFLSTVERGRNYTLERVRVQRVVVLNVWQGMGEGKISFPKKEYIVG